jgi:hypothetical protein
MSAPLAHTGSINQTSRESLLERRVLSIWPRFDRRAIRRANHDPRRVAAMVGRRTRLPEEAILRLLTMPALSDDDVDTWFG